jgi:hypothetical protein
MEKQMKIIVTNQAYAKVMHWVRKADFEVSGYGTAHWDVQQNAFVVTDAYLIKQMGGPAHTEIDAVALGKLVHRIEDVEKKGQIKWWWHSHVNMEAFWSGTDTETIRSLGIHGWMTASVFNKKGEHKSGVCYLSTSEFSQLVHTDYDVKTEIQYTAAPSTDWDKEFDETVEREVYQPTMYMGYDSLAKTQGNLINPLHNDTQKRGPGRPRKSEKNMVDHWYAKEYKDYGLVCDSAAEEARLLNIPLKKYKNILLNGSEEQLDALTNKLLERGVKAV